MLSHVSLFSGIGGFDLAAEWAGIQTVMFAEKDSHCQDVLRKHWPDVPILDDVRSVDDSIKADIITGGFPCQDLSVAGRRAGLAGERSGLWGEFCRILAAVRPTWVVIENVPGLLSSNEGRDMGTILWALGQLGYGYAYRVFDAQYFGVAQRRRRVFIVGCLGDGRRAAEVLLEPESLCGNPPPSREKGKEIAGTLGGGSPHRGFGTGELDSHGAYIVATALTASAGHHGHSSPRGDGADNLVVARIDNAGANGCGILGDGTTHALGGATDVIVAGFLAGQGSKAGGIAYRSEQAPTLKASHSGTNTVPTIFQQNQRNEVREMEVAGALSAQPGMKQQNYTTGANCTVRRLTPLECERLQGFPDGWTTGHSDSHRYKMLGNAVAVPVAYEILRSIVEVEA